MESVADRNYAWFKRHRADLAYEHPGEYVVIVDESAAGIFASLDEAIEGALAVSRPGQFLIQQCVPDDEEHSQYFCSLARATHA